MISRLFTAILLLSFLLPALVTAGTISGQVTDASGRPVSNVLVSAGGQSDISDVYGKYKLMNVPDGQQKLQARKDNTVKDVEVTVGPNTSQNITLP
jgi:hypothetical protein